jgi:alpha-amylase
LYRIIIARKELSFGQQRDYFEDANTLGWTREGTDDKPESGIAVLLTNAGATTKRMDLGKRNANTTFVDIYGGKTEKIKTDENGSAEFHVNEKFVSIWIREEASKFFQ